MISFIVDRLFRLIKQNKETQDKKKADPFLKWQPQFYDITAECDGLLRLVKLLSENTQEEFNKFTFQSIINLIQKVMVLQNKIAKELNEENLPFKDRNEIYVIHLEQYEQAYIVENFHQVVSKMLRQTFSIEINKEFIDFYTWTEDIRQLSIQKVHRLVQTHMFKDKLEDLLKQQTKSKLKSSSQAVIPEDDRLINDFELQVQSLLDSVLEFQIQIGLIYEDTISQQTLNKLFNNILQIGNEEKKLAEKIGQLPESLSKLKKLNECCFSTTLAYSETVSYMQAFNINHNLSMKDEDFLYFFQEDAFSEAYFERFLYLFDQFISKISKNHISDDYQFKKI